MKRLFSLFMALAALAFVAIPVYAAVNVVTPSTNDINRTNSWAHVDQLSQGIGTMDLKFISTRAFWSCFEYRIDNEPNTVTGSNPNPGVTDGRWTQVCVNNSQTTKTIEANEYVDVRMVYGAETDERFDWTRFDVLFNRTATIISPEVNSIVSGVVSFDATLNDKDKNDSVSWAIRKGTCAANTNTVFGNVDGFNNPYDWNHTDFHATADTTLWGEGEYCFVFNPSESAGDTAIRETREFTVNNTPDNKEQCKNDGWKTFFTPTFKNQGDCVSSIQSSPKAIGNKK